MSQTDFNVANASGAAVRADINAHLDALASLSSGASAPSTIFPNQWWYDTSTGQLKKRNNANTAWLTTPQIDAVLDTNGNAINESEGAAVASASTTDIWATDGNTLHITGATTIVSFGTAPRIGAWRKVIFDGALTLTDGANLNLQGGANITTAVDDFAFVYAETTTLFKVLYFKASGIGIVAKIDAALDTNGHAINESEASAVASATTTNIWAINGNTLHITGTLAITSFGTAPRVGAWRKVIFDGVLTLTDGANLNLPGGGNITTAVDDFAFVYAETTTLFKVLYFKADGTSISASTISQATKSNIEAETDENTYTPPDLLRHTPGIAKQWVKFDLNGTVNASYNTSSVSDTSPGNWTVNIAANMSTVNYSISLSWRDDSAGGVNKDLIGGSQAAGTYQVTLVDADTIGDPAVADDMHCQAFGDQ